jgi:ribosomal subunit interface protein
MIVQFNTDKNIEGTDAFRNYVAQSVMEELHRFSDHISRVDVHLSDENGHKEGKNDKKCVIEARIEGRQPIAVTHHADNNELAISGAIGRMKHALDTVFDRMKSH